VAAPVHPFCLFDPQFLPEKKLRDTLKSQWKPVFSMMEGGIDQSLFQPNLSEQQVKAMFDNGVANIKSHASYIWMLDKSKPESWVVSNWSKRVQRGAIERDGTLEDKAALPQANKRNRSHPSYSKQPRKKKKVVKKTAPVTKPPKTAEPTGKTKDDALDLLASDDDEPEGITAVGRGDDKIMFQVSGPDPARPKRGSDPILMCHLRALHQQGEMIQACVVRSYFSALVRPFHHLGVRCVGTGVWDEWV